MAKRLSGLRLVLVGVILAVALSACSFSTDTVATVGGERITRGELHAAIATAQAAGQGASLPVDPAAILNDLISDRLLVLAGRDQRVQVTPGEINAKIAEDVTAINAGSAQNRDQQIGNLVVGASRELRPIVNNYGGNAIPEADLQAVIAQEIAGLRNLLVARGTVMRQGSAPLPDQTIEDQAITFRNGLAGKGVAVPPETLEPLVTVLAQRLVSDGYLATPVDDFQAVLAQAPLTNKAYQQNVHQRLLLEKLRPVWYKPEVRAVVLQGLLTDSPAKAQEAIQKARAGTPFAEVVKAYHLATSPSQTPDNTLGSFPVELLPQQLRSVLKLEEGAVSEPIVSVDGRQFTIYRIAKIEQRAPTTQEESRLAQVWLDGLRAKYPVTILDPALSTPVR